MSPVATIVDEVRQFTGDDSSVSPVQNYRYRDAQLNIIWTTSVPKDDEAAVAYFHTIMQFGKGFKPVYLEKNFAEANQGEDYIMLPYVFDPETRTTEER